MQELTHYINGEHVKGTVRPCPMPLATLFVALKSSNFASARRIT